MTTIYLIRHGQAEGNLYRRCHSWHNGLLTLKGREQVKALEKRFEGVSFDAVYSSDLYRAMSTAGAIYRPRALPCGRSARASGRTCLGASSSMTAVTASQTFWPAALPGGWRAARLSPMCAAVWTGPSAASPPHTRGRRWL